MHPAELVVPEPLSPAFRSRTGRKLTGSNPLARQGRKAAVSVVNNDRRGNESDAQPCFSPVMTAELSGHEASESGSLSQMNI